MARRYARDNRGRFSSAGATARGGRLRTAAGNKRATQTAKISGGKPAGAIKGKVKRDPGAAGKIGASKPKATAKSANRPDSAKPASAPRATSARRKAVGKISEAKAGRIISRIDANRPGLRKASGSARKTANAIRTQRAATDFALAAGARARKKGQNLSVNQSLQRAVANAAKSLKG